MAEGIQMHYQGSQYFTKFWNLLDLTSFLLTILYCVNFMFFDKDSEVEAQTFLSLNADIRKIIYILILCVVWVRGISFLRIFEKTRYLIHLIIEVVKDMGAFLLIMIYSDFLFASLYFALSSDLTWVLQLETVFLLQLGDFNVEDYSITEMSVFVFASIINLILMLNLLISIIADTFDRVLLQKTLFNSHALLQMC